MLINCPEQVKQQQRQQQPSLLPRLTASESLSNVYALFSIELYGGAIYLKPAQVATEYTQLQFNASLCAGTAYLASVNHVRCGMGRSYFTAVDFNCSIFLR